MKVVFENGWYIIYNVGGSEYIMIDKYINFVVCVFNKSEDGCVFDFRPGRAWCYSNHNYYNELIDQIK